MDNVGNIIWVAPASFGEDAANIYFDAFCLKGDCNCRIVDSGDGQMLHVMVGDSNEV